MLVSRMQIRKLRTVYGILVLILGWLIANTKYIPFMHKLLCPQYHAAATAQRKLYDKIPLRRGDVGFSEIAQILETKYDIKDINYIIPVQLKLKVYPNGVKNVEVVLDITYFGTEKFSAQLDLKSAIRSVYLTKDYFVYSFIIFTIGVLILLYPAFRIRKADRI
jgi:hypothetical protein